MSTTLYSMAQMASTSTFSNRVTGVTYDKCLESHFSLWNKDYTEHPLRTKVCIERCEQLGLLSRCKRIQVREATLNEINACHSEEHFDLLHTTECMDEKELQQISQRYDYSYFHKDSFKNARLALGATIDLVDEIVTEKISNGMAIVRPPGHHAMRNEFSGYCYFNNVAVAAQLMIDNHGLDRIVILDWDVHHGQGSQFLFYDDPRVMYISIHRYEFGDEWPKLRESDYDFIGEGKGKGFNINLPLNEVGCDNDDYLANFFHIILPICQEYNPQLFLVSAGFDSAIGCPEGEMFVTPACFAHFINLLTPLASGKMALILEGGYNMRSLAESAALSLRTLLGDTIPSISPITQPRLSVTESVLNSVKVLWPYWKCLHCANVVDRKQISEETYPYQYVLQNPPKEGMEFHDDETRPKLFPLIQECIGIEVFEKMEAAERMIDDLLENTSLTCPSLKLCTSHDGSHSASYLYSLLQEELEERQLWNKCQSISSSKENCVSKENGVHPLQLCISKCVDSMIDYTVESSVVITGHGDHKSNSTVNGSRKEEEEAITLAVKYAMKSYVQKILLLRITEDESMTDLSENTPGVLTISISINKNKDKSQHHEMFTRKQSVSDTQTDATNIHIPFCSKSTTEADILSAFYFIVLPVCYEFCPDFVIFSWNTNVQIPTSSMEHITQYLSGLARGKVLTLVNHQSSSSSSPISSSETKTASSSMHIMSASPVVPKLSLSAKNGDCHHDNLTKGEKEKIFINCMKVLLEKKCSPLSGFHLSDEGVNVIKQTVNKVKEHWKSLVFKEKVPKQT